MGKRMKKINEVTRGCINYYRIADMKRILTRIEDKIRLHIRMGYWKQWKTIKNRANHLYFLGIGDMPAHERGSVEQDDGLGDG